MWFSSSSRNQFVIDKTGQTSTGSMIFSKIQISFNRDRMFAFQPNTEMYLHLFLSAPTLVIYIERCFIDWPHDENLTQRPSEFTLMDDWPLLMAVKLLSSLRVKMGCYCCWSVEFTTLDWFLKEFSSNGCCWLCSWKRPRLHRVMTPRPARQAKNKWKGRKIKGKKWRRPMSNNKEMRR